MYRRHEALATLKVCTKVADTHLPYPAEYLSRLPEAQGHHVPDHVHRGYVHLWCAHTIPDDVPLATSPVYVVPKARVVMTHQLLGAIPGRVCKYPKCSRVTTF